MDENNPYRAPESVVADVQVEGAPLASLSERFLGSLIDGIIMLVIVLPIMFATGYFTAISTGQQPGIGTMVLYVLMGFGIFCLVQGYPLAQSAQTWGKKVVKTRIVDLAGGQPSLGTLLGKRYFPVQAVSAVPVIGNVLALVNVLFIFRSDRRCVHDLIAGTRVVKAG